MSPRVAPICDVPYLASWRGCSVHKDTKLSQFRTRNSSLPHNTEGPSTAILRSRPPPPSKSSTNAQSYNGGIISSTPVPPSKCKSPPIVSTPPAISNTNQFLCLLLIEVQTLLAPQDETSETQDLWLQIQWHHHFVRDWFSPKEILNETESIIQRSNQLDPLLHRSQPFPSLAWLLLNHFSPSTHQEVHEHSPIIASAYQVSPCGHPSMDTFHDDVM